MDTAVSAAEGKRWAANSSGGPDRDFTPTSAARTGEDATRLMPMTSRIGMKNGWKALRSVADISPSLE